MLQHEVDAKVCFEESANEKGDFETRQVVEYSELGYYRAFSLHALGQTSEAIDLLKNMESFAIKENKNLMKLITSLHHSQVERLS